MPNNPLTDVVDWTFLNEPIWRWVIFIGALLAILWGWHGVIELMK